MDAAPPDIAAGPTVHVRRSPCPPLAAARSDMVVPQPELTKCEIDMLSFERQWWRLAGAKEQAIREQFEMSPTRYYQTLNALLDSRAALEHDPALVNRLRRLRTVRLHGRP